MKMLLPECAKMMLCSGVLLGAYRLLLDRRAPLSWCRLYLLLLPPVACIIPLLRIPLLPAPVIGPVDIEPLPLVEPAPAAATPAAAFPLAATLLLTLWLIGMLVLFAAMLRQMIRIRRLHRGAALRCTGRIRLVLTARRIAPFSFGHTIYLWEATPEQQRQAIIAHETSHITHRHSAERIVMECMKALLWWNPFVWMAARRLTEAQEYEADRDVLAGGYDRACYMNVLFEQLFGYSPDIANGLQNSLTKKRFQMMTTSIGGRYALLRLAGTALAATGLLCAFSLTTRAAEIRTTSSSADSFFASAESEPLYIVNGTEVSKEEFFTSNRSETGHDYATVRILHGEKAIAEYGERGKEGVLEMKTRDNAGSGIESASATTRPEVTAARRGEAARPAADADEPMLMAERMPRFRGGDLLAFRTWVQERLQYPDTEATGRVVASFIVERDGSMGSVVILQTPDETLSREALRVLGSVPAGSWSPGLQNGEPVRVKYTLPLDFRVVSSATSAEER